MRAKAEREPRQQLCKKIYKLFFLLFIPMSWLRELLLKILSSNLERDRSSNELKDYYENKYQKTEVFYNGRVIPSSKKRIDIDVRNFFNLEDAQLKKLVKQAKVQNKTDDQKAVELLKLVMAKVSYVSDKKSVGLPEFWEFPYETLYLGQSDCEGGSILLANLLIIAGIPSWKVRVSAGLVQQGNERPQGHCYVTYFSEETQRWHLLDWCYYPEKIPISQRKEYKKEKIYKSTWFSFNDRHGFAGDVRDIENMKNIKGGQLYGKSKG